MDMQNIKNTHKNTEPAEQWINFLKTISNSEEHLYMIIDCAHDTRILPALAKSLNSRCCLFNEENVSETIKAVAPFLVKIKNIDEFVSWCISEGMHRHWMIFFTSADQHVSDLRLHFKHFSLAHTPDGKQYFFRYYDARVLPVFITSCEQRERDDFFRHCKTIWVPQVSHEGSAQLLQLDITGAAQVLLNP
ncbi:MAG: hypothetical protein B0W54_23580 [Cellvibrio sp. 79]|nr:MAG: hypothetical protein B0W54_23580 [Cellvibrio sp. 79]